MNLQPAPQLDFADPAATTAPGATVRTLRRSSQEALPPLECGVVRALAAYQLRYGFAEEAIVLLLVARRLWPADIPTLTLLAQALLLARHDISAEVILIDSARRDRRMADPAQSLLSRSILLLRRLKVPEARQMFLQFLNRRRHGAH
jgi:hypothetical protein